MKIQRFEDALAISRAAASEFVRLAADAIRERGMFSVALSGGSTPKRMFEILADPPLSERVDWSRVHVFWGDERSVPADHEDSNFRMAREALLSRVPIPADHVHRMQAEREDKVAAASDYAHEIARVFGCAPDGKPPVFDLVLLGMGPDGHTASLFPETEALGERSRWVVPNFVPKFDTYRMTLSAPFLSNGREILFLVAGADKASVLAEVLEGPRDSQRLPSQLIEPTGGSLRWFVDRAAGAALSDRSEA